MIKIINHLKVHTLNSHLFMQFCEEMDGEHTHLLLFTEVRWFSKGRPLARVFELQEPLHWFLLEKQSLLAAHFSNTERVAKLAYLCDIFNLLNEPNLSLKGRMTAVFKSANKVAAWEDELELWGWQVSIRIFGVLNSSRDFERDWARAFFLPAGAWTPISAFKRGWALLPNHKRPLNWEGMDLWPICE